MGVTTDDQPANCWECTIIHVGEIQADVVVPNQQQQRNVKPARGGDAMGIILNWCGGRSLYARRRRESDRQKQQQQQRQRRRGTANERRASSTWFHNDDDRAGSACSAPPPPSSWPVDGGTEARWRRLCFTQQQQHHQASG